MLRINDAPEQVREGKVSSHAAVPLEFEVLRSDPGTYLIDINGQQAYFTIVGEQRSADSSKTIPLIGFIICAIGVVVVSILLIRRLRTSY